MSNLAITGGEGVANNAASAGCGGRPGRCHLETPEQAHAHQLHPGQQLLDSQSPDPPGRCRGRCHLPERQGNACAQQLHPRQQLRPLRQRILTAFDDAIYNAGTLTGQQQHFVHGNTVGIWSFEVSNGGNGGAIYSAGTLTVSGSTCPATPLTKTVTAMATATAVASSTPSRRPRPSRAAPSPAATPSTTAAASTTTAR